MKFWSEVLAVRGGCSRPERVDQAVSRHCFGCLEEKEREYRALLQPTEKERARLIDDLKWSEDPKVRHLRFVTRSFPSE